MHMQTHTHIYIYTYFSYHLLAFDIYSIASLVRALRHLFSAAGVFREHRGDLSTHLSEPDFHRLWQVRDGLLDVPLRLVDLQDQRRGVVGLDAVLEAAEVRAATEARLLEGTLRLSIWWWR